MSMQAPRLRFKLVRPPTTDHGAPPVGKTGDGAVVPWPYTMTTRPSPRVAAAGWVRWNPPWEAERTAGGEPAGWVKVAAMHTDRPFDDISIVGVANGAGSNGEE